jgi:hypothetical protein
LARFRDAAASILEEAIEEFQQYLVLIDEVEFGGTR